MLAIGVLLVSATACSGAGGGNRGVEGPVSGGGTLRIALGQAEADLNIFDFKTHSFNVLDQLYEPLVRYGPNGTLQPALAERWDVSEDGLTSTFHLRGGVLFSDGTPFTAEVAKADMQRWIGNPDNSFIGIATNTESIDTPDERTLVLRLKQPYYPALQELSFVRPVRFPSPTAFDASGTFVKPVGTGPYKLESMSTTEIVLVRNDSYWGGRPNLDKVIFKVIPDSQARLAALKAGEVDMIGGDYLAPLAPEEAVQLKDQSQITLLSQPAETNLLLTFNLVSGNPALSDPQVREAINYALPRQAYAATLFNGLARPAHQVFPPDIPYAPKADSQPLEFNTDKASGLLSDAGYTGSGTRSKGGTRLSFRLILDPDLLPQAKALSEAVQADLAKVGIDIQIDTLDSTAYADASTKRDFDLKFYPTYGPPYDPFGLLNNNFRTDQKINLYSSPELDQRIAAALSATSDPERAAAYDEVWTKLNENWAVAPLVELPRVWAIRTTVKGFVLGPTEYDLPLTGVGVTN
ncbi:MAG: ABC transporter substrate-binding protein [Pseudonocardiaceae bacterium]